MILFDSHTHLTDEQYEGMQETIVNNAKANGVKYIVDIGYNKETSIEALKNANKFEDVYATCGMHPENIDEIDDDLKFIYELCHDTKIVAIGEIGLDYHYDGDRERQKEVFMKQIQIANELDKPVVIHSRDADMDMLEILKNNKINAGFVMHCFSSSTEILKEILKLRRLHFNSWSCDI